MSNSTVKVQEGAINGLIDIIAEASARNTLFARAGAQQSRQRTLHAKLDVPLTMSKFLSKDNLANHALQERAEAKIALQHVTALADLIEEGLFGLLDDNNHLVEPTRRLFDLVDTLRWVTSEQFTRNASSN
jgi:hypothetical protein